MTPDDTDGTPGGRESLSSRKHMLPGRYDDYEGPDKKQSKKTDKSQTQLAVH